MDIITDHSIAFRPEDYFRGLRQLGMNPVVSLSRLVIEANQAASDQFLKLEDWAYREDPDYLERRAYARERWKRRGSNDHTVPLG